MLIHPQWSNFKPFFEIKYSLETIEAGTKSSLSKNSKAQSPNSKSGKSEQDSTYTVYSHQTSPKTP